MIMLVWNYSGDCRCSEECYSGAPCSRLIVPSLRGQPVMLISEVELEPFGIRDRVECRETL